MLVAVAGWLGSRDVELAGDQIPRAVRGLQQSAADVDLTRHDRQRLRPIRRRRLAAIDLGHERSPRRCRENAALRVVLDLLRTVESHPHAGDKVGGVADEPDVGAVVRRSRFSAGGKVKARFPDAGRASATNHVFHHVDHDPGFLGRQHLRARRRRLPQNLSLLILDSHYRVRGRADAEIGEYAVGGDQLDRIDVGGADVDRWIRRNRSGDAEIPRLINDGLLAELHAKPDGGDVAGEVEGLPERNLSQEFQIVVLGRPFGLTGHLEHERTVVDEI